MKRQQTICLFLFLLLGACKKSKGPTCSEVSAHFIALVEGELARNPNTEEKTAAKANLPALQNALQETCESYPFDENVRACILAATAAADIEECKPNAPTPPQEKTTP